MNTTKSLVTQNSNATQGMAGQVIIKNEILHAEEMIEKGFLLKNKMILELVVLWQYYSGLGMDNMGIETRLHDFCKFWLRERYNYVKFIKILENVKKIAKKRTIREEKRVIFTKKEMNLLADLDNEKRRRVLFSMMFFGKVQGHNYCNVKDTIVFRMAGAYTKKADRIEIYRDLYMAGYIHPTMTGGDKIICADEDIGVGIVDEEKIAFEVVDFENPILYFYEWFGEKIGFCERCGKRIKLGSNRQKYCGECAGLIKYEGWRKILDRKREGRDGVG